MARKRPRVLLLLTTSIVLLMWMMGGRAHAADRRPVVQVTTDVSGADNKLFRTRILSEMRSDPSLAEDVSEDRYLARRLANALQVLLPVCEFVTEDLRSGVRHANELRFEFRKKGRLIWPAGELELNIRLFRNGAPVGLPVTLLALRVSENYAIDAVVAQLTRAYDQYALQYLLANVPLRDVVFERAGRRLITDQTYRSLSIVPSWPALGLIFGWGNHVLAACSSQGARPDNVIEGITIEWPARAGADCRGNGWTDVGMGPGRGIHFVHYYRANMVN